MTADDTTAPQATDVAIIGAGLAGLTAARLLMEAGARVIVLEARERPGGRTYTRMAASGVSLDLGAQWIGPTQRRIAALAATYGLTTFPTWDTGNNVQYANGQRRIYSGAIPTSDPLVSADIVEAMLSLNMMAMQVPLDAPWASPSAREWDGQTVESWVRAEVRSEGARDLLTLGVQAVFSAEPRDLSLLHFLFYTHSGGGLMDLLGVTGGAQERRFHGGAQSVANHIAADLGEHVRYNAPVRAITQDERGVQVVADGISVRARNAIVAIPPALAGRFRYSPPLPGYRDQLTQRMPMGSVIKVHALYDAPFWRDADLTGQASSDTGPVRITFDNSPESGAPGALVGFIEGDDARVWGRRSEAERRAAVLECFARYFGPPAAEPVEYIEYSWMEDGYARGCYAGYMPPGVWTAYGEALREPIGHIHWAGTETATEWNGYMDGAVQSGERAAAEVAAALGIRLRQAEEETHGNA